MAPAIKIHPDVQNALRPLTEDEYTGLRLGIELEGCYLPLLYFRADNTNYLLDGHHRWRICTELGVWPPWRLMEGIKTVEEAVAWVKEHQASRRNLSPEEIKELRILRIERVAESRAKGASLRTIAEAEGVSPETVRQDLQAATVQGLTVDPPDMRVNSRDGVPRPSTTSQFCSRCQRTGPVKDCPQCAALRTSPASTHTGGRRTYQRKQGPKSGEEAYKQSVVDEHVSRVAAEADKLAHQYGRLNGRGQPSGPAHAGILRLCRELSAACKAWETQLKKEAKGG